MGISTATASVPIGGGGNGDGPAQDARRRRLTDAADVGELERDQVGRRGQRRRLGPHRRRRDGPPRRRHDRRQRPAHHRRHRRPHDPRRQHVRIHLGDAPLAGRQPRRRPDDRPPVVCRLPSPNVRQFSFSFRPSLFSFFFPTVIVIRVYSPMKNRQFFSMTQL